MCARQSYSCYVRSQSLLPQPSPPSPQPTQPPVVIRHHPLFPLLRHALIYTLLALRSMHTTHAHTHTRIHTHTHTVYGIGRPDTFTMEFQWRPGNEGVSCRPTYLPVYFGFGLETDRCPLVLQMLPKSRSCAPWLLKIVPCDDMTSLLKQSTNLFCACRSGYGTRSPREGSYLRCIHNTDSLQRINHPRAAVATSRAACKVVHY